MQLESAASQKNHDIPIKNEKIPTETLSQQKQATSSSLINYHCTRSTHMVEPRVSSRMLFMTGIIEKIKTRGK